MVYTNMSLTLLQACVVLENLQVITCCRCLLPALCMLCPAVQCLQDAVVRGCINELSFIGCSRLSAAGASFNSNKLPFGMLCCSCCCAVAPSAQAVLADDPYFVLKDVGGPNPNVRLRISRLSQLIGHPEMVEEYRWSVDRFVNAALAGHNGIYHTLAAAAVGIQAQTVCAPEGSCALRHSIGSRNLRMKQ